MSWRRVVEAPCQLGESPFWHPEEQSLYWVDIPGCAILRAKLQEGVFMGTQEAWPMAQQPGCIAPVQGGGLLIALRDGIYLAKEWGGSLQRICVAPYDSTQLRFNDGKADPQGRFWVGSYCDSAASPDGALYCLERGNLGGQTGGALGLSLVEKARPARVSNGLAFSPDHQTLYWSDTFQGKIFAFDWDAASNQMQNQRVFQQFDAKPANWAYGAPGYQNYQGRPDGATVDVEGNYYVAMFEGAAVLKLSPRGELLQKIPLPAMCPTMPCLGGDDLKTLFVTTASIGRSASELAALPWSGCTLAMRVDVPGLPVDFVRAEGLKGHAT